MAFSARAKDFLKWLKAQYEEDDYPERENWTIRATPERRAVFAELRTKGIVEMFVADSHEFCVTQKGMEALFNLDDEASGEEQQATITNIHFHESTVGAISIGGSSTAGGSVTQGASAPAGRHDRPAGGAAVRSDEAEDSPPPSVTVRVNETGRLTCTDQELERLVLEVDGLLAAGSVPRLDLGGLHLKPPEPPHSGVLTGEETEELARARLAFSKAKKKSQALRKNLTYLLFDRQFRPLFVPRREQATRVLRSLVDDHGVKQARSGFTKIDLFLEKNRAIGTAVFLSDAEMLELAAKDSCQGIADYKEKLLALMGDNIVALSTDTRLDTAYPAIVLEIVRLRELGKADDSMVQPGAWGFGLG